METVFWGVGVVGVSVVLAFAGFLVARRLVSYDLREAHNSSIAVMFGALYVMYGLIVGFSAYFVAYQYDTAQKVAQGEATSVEEIHRLAEGFPEAKRQEVQTLSEAYVRLVVDEGWPMMREGRVGGRRPSGTAKPPRPSLAFESGTEREDALYSQALTLVADLNEGRSSRLLEVREGIPAILWIVLIVGGVVTVCFTYLLGVQTELLHVVMILAYTLVLALILYAVRALDYPFDGLAQVGPDAFEAALSRMESQRSR